MPVSLAIRGIWIPAIPAGMTRFSLSWRVWVANPVPRGNSNNHFSNIGQYIVDSKETHFEIQKLQLIVEQQHTEIAYLKEIIELTKNQKREAG